VQPVLLWTKSCCHFSVCLPLSRCILLHVARITGCLGCSTSSRLARSRSLLMWTCRETALSQCPSARRACRTSTTAATLCNGLSCNDLWRQQHTLLHRCSAQHALRLRELCLSMQPTCGMLHSCMVKAQRSIVGLVGLPSCLGLCEDSSG